MAGKICLYFPEGTDAEKIASAFSEQIKIEEARAYAVPKEAGTDAVKAAKAGETCIVAANAADFAAVKLSVLKGLSVRILRSSKISGALGDKISPDSKEYNVQTALPSGGEAYPSSDGMNSAFSCRTGEGRIILVPAEEDRLKEAVEAGAAGAALPEKSSKEMLADRIRAVEKSGKKIAVADFGKAAAMMTVINSVGDDCSTFALVTALTDAQFGAKDFEANLAKSAKETAQCDYGVVVSEVSSDGVTICVADSETARVEKIHAAEGEDAKHLLAAAVMRLCEMVQEAAEEGITVPNEAIPHVSKKAFIIIISCLVAAIIACVALCVVLFAKNSGTDASESTTGSYDMSADAGTDESQLEAMGEVSPFLAGDMEVISTTAGDDDFSGTTYVGAANYAAAGSGFTTVATTVIDAIKEVTGSTEAQTDENGSTIEASTEETTEAEGRFVFTVYGWGHGVGMSQDGAKVLARNGKTCNQILTYYYPNTTIMTDKNTPMYIEDPDENGEGGYTLLEFLCKTVKQEIGPEAPYEALKAQAVAAYTYARYHNNFGAGQTIDNSFAYEGTNVEKAVMDVLNITSADQQPHANYVSWNGTYANTVYYANCAGKTASSPSVWGGSKIPYLSGGIESPETVSITTKEFTVSEMKRMISNYADSNGLTADFDSNPAKWLSIKSHDGAYNSAVGYVNSINVCGMSMSGNEFRTNVVGGQLRSHCFTIQYITG